MAAASCGFLVSHCERCWWAGAEYYHVEHLACLPWNVYYIRVFCVPGWSIVTLEGQRRGSERWVLGWFYSWKFVEFFSIMSSWWLENLSKPCLHVWAVLSPFQFQLSVLSFVQWVVLQENVVECTTQHLIGQISKNTPACKNMDHSFVLFFFLRLIYLF